ncbi:disintegrin and metalloproteinase domain-containing protein 17 [Paragonimus westermani]|uniref:Disintegrin and metalloproteinase domain-containing protein 17 n=1 Tax=Paragonimus westermani TaxID=34504 RepID=A0A5J4NJ72_9TREM|nr:disintegrin and metalloproteinase domain-containing protein 17 [Paragonimus westermani]
MLLYLMVTTVFLSTALHIGANILTQLNSYEIIDAPYFRTRRWTHDSYTTREISFPVQNSMWHLILDSTEPQVSPNFTVTVLGENGFRNLSINLHDLVCYTGHIFLLENSSVTALVEENTNEFSAKIVVEDHIYFIEPLSTYAEYKGNTSMLFYRLKDVNYYPLANVSFCGSSEGSIVPSLQYSAADAISGMANRTRRQVNMSDKKLCSLTFIADHTFFENVGDRNVPKTTRLIIALFYRLNALYQSATFLIDEEIEMSGFGFLLGDIIIHESWTSRLGHYNAPSDVGGKTWTPHALSDAFNRASFNRTCLAHLLTYRPFMGVLGRAWMASSNLGGICSPPVKQGDLMIHTNTGWTTYVDHSGRRLLNAMVELITAHELGHNWGAAHDPDTTECSPPALSRGKYLMYAHSVAGFAENNYKFSPCSRRTIGATLAVRAPLCFAESSQTGYSRCGNRRLDPGEECDTGVGNDNPCCSAGCKLRPHARCSPWNHECCTADCQIATASTICAERRSSNPCLGPGKCDGLSVHCPGPTLLSNVACAEHGQCVRGQCVPHCLRLGLETCICDAAEQSCYICCQFPEADSQSFVCKPVVLLHTDTSFERTVGRYSFVPDHSLPGTPLPAAAEHFPVHKFQNQPITKYIYLHLEDYRPCATGYCMQGKCQLFKQNSILRFQGLYDKPEDQSLGKSRGVLRCHSVNTVYLGSCFHWARFHSVPSRTHRMSEHRALVV